MSHSSDVFRYVGRRFECYECGNSWIETVHRSRHECFECGRVFGFEPIEEDDKEDYSLPASSGVDGMLILWIVTAVLAVWALGWVYFSIVLPIWHSIYSVLSLLPFIG